MTILRHYKMTATEGRGSDLRSALEELAIKVRPLPGCEAVRLFADPEDPLTFVFIEDWRSLDDHKAAGRPLPRSALDDLASLPGGISSRRCRSHRRRPRAPFLSSPRKRGPDNSGRAGSDGPGDLLRPLRHPLLRLADHIGADILGLRGRQDLAETDHALVLERAVDHHRLPQRRIVERA